MLVKLTEPVQGVGAAGEVVLIQDRWVASALIQSGRGVAHKPETFAEVAPEPEPEPNNTSEPALADEPVVGRNRNRKVGGPRRTKE